MSLIAGGHFLCGGKEQVHPNIARIADKLSDVLVGEAFQSISFIMHI